MKACYNKKPFPKFQTQKIHLWAMILSIIASCCTLIWAIVSINYQSLLVVIVFATLLAILEILAIIIFAWQIKTSSDKKQIQLVCFTLLAPLFIPIFVNYFLWTKSGYPLKRILETIVSWEQSNINQYITKFTQKVQGEPKLSQSALKEIRVINDLYQDNYINLVTKNKSLWILVKKDLKLAKLPILYNAIQIRRILKDN